MKITMYELLGLVKDGKAPYKIKYDNMIWEFDGDFYRSQDNYILEGYCNLTTSLNYEVEILDKSVEEKKIPEKLDWNKNDFTYPEGNLMSEETADMLMEIQDKINNIIDILDKGENK